MKTLWTNSNSSAVSPNVCICLMPSAVVRGSVEWGMPPGPNLSMVDHLNDDR
ncbi:MAG: hypothetical protein Q7R56_00785 [Nanoarchaeota archaeon]|nr:hypothetical protein [Nanoarchaeota archaeon]